MRVHWGLNPDFPDYWEVTAEQRAKAGDSKKIFRLRKYIARVGHTKAFLRRTQVRMEERLYREVRMWRQEKWGRGEWKA